MLPLSVTFPVASVLAVLTSLSPSRSSTVASGTGRFFSSITERRITQVRESSAEVIWTQQIAMQTRNALVTTLRNRADGNRCPTLASFIRMRMARKEYVELDRKEHTSELQSLRHLVCRL